MVASVGVGVAPAAAAGPGVTAKTITIGLITSLTGEAAPQYTDILPAARASVALQSAQGGVGWAEDSAHR